MLKSFYKKFIINAFGQYLENFDEKVIEVSSWQGTFLAENLILKKSALDLISQNIGIPLQILFGTIKKMQLQIEWDQILSTPSYISLSDVHILVKAKHSYDPKFHEMIKARLKNDIIEKKFKEIYENIFNKNEKYKEYSQTNISPSVTWKQKLLKSFAQNLNLVIDNIHIRFEENYQSKRCFNFGMCISRLEWLNTNKNGDEYFVDYETRKEMGKSFTSMKVYRFSLYFNSSGRNVNGNASNVSGSHESEIKNFSSNDSERNLDLINYINVSSMTLPPVYEQFLDFSLKFFNPSSLEYSKQFFVIDPIDFCLKIRKNINSEKNKDLPLHSYFLEMHDDVSLKINDNIFMDLIYLFNLRKYHALDNPILAVKKDFLELKYSSEQYKSLLRSAGEKIMGQRYNKRKLQDTLEMIKNYKELYYRLLLNSHEYSACKLSNEELRSCKINEQVTKFNNLSEMRNLFYMIQSNLSEKLVYYLRLETLIRFKHYLISDSTGSNVEAQTGGGLFKIFSIFRRKSDSTHQAFNPMDNLLIENHDFIDTIVEKDLNLLKHSHHNIKQRLSYKCFKVNSLHLMLFFQKFHAEKNFEIMKISFTNLILQSMETNLSKTFAFLCDDLNILDQSLLQTRFKYVLCKSKRFTKMYLNDSGNCNSLSDMMNSSFDEMIYDNDGILLPLTKKSYGTITGHFMKIFHKKYIRAKIKKIKSIDESLIHHDASLYDTKILADFKPADVFLNINFWDNLYTFQHAMKSENTCIQSYLNLTSQPCSSISKDIKDHNISQTHDVTHVNFKEISFFQIRIFILFNIYNEDYRCFIIDIREVKVNSENFTSSFNISSLQLSFSANFLYLLNDVDNKSKSFDILQVNLQVEESICAYSNTILKTSYIENINIYLNHSVITSIFEICQLISQSQIMLTSKDTDNTNTNTNTTNNNDNEICHQMLPEEDISDDCESHDTEIFQEAHEHVETATNVEFPIAIKHEKTNLKVTAIKIFLEQNAMIASTRKGYFYLSINSLEGNSDEDYSKHICDRKLHTPVVTFGFYEHGESGTGNLNFNSEKDCIEVSFSQRLYMDIHRYNEKEITVNINSFAVFKNNLALFTENILSYKDMASGIFNGVESQSQNVSEEKNKILMNININQLEVYYDNLNTENELSDKKITVNSAIFWTINDMTLHQISFDKLMISENRNFSFSCSCIDCVDKNNTILPCVSVEYNVANSTSSVKIQEIYLTITTGILGNLKSFYQFREYLARLKLRLGSGSSVNSKRRITEIKIDIRKIEACLDLFESSEVKCFLDDISFSKSKLCSEILMKNFQVNLTSKRISSDRDTSSISNNNNNNNFLSLSNLCMIEGSIEDDTDEKSYSLLLEGTSTVKVFYYHISVFRDCNKFLMNVRSSMISEMGGNYQTTYKSIVKVRSFDVYFYDFFLKEKVDEISNNTKYFIIVSLDNLYYRKAVGELDVTCSFNVSSSEDRILRGSKKIAVSKVIMMMENENDEASKDSSVNIDSSTVNTATQSNVIIKMHEEQLTIEISTLEMLISENVLSANKLVRKYMSMVKHYFTKDKSVDKFRNISSKIIQLQDNETTSNRILHVFLDILKMKMFLFKIDNVGVKFKSTTNTLNERENLEVSCQNSLVFKFALEFFFSHKSQTGLPNPEHANLNSNVNLNLNLNSNANDTISGASLLFFPPSFSWKVSNIKLYLTSSMKQIDSIVKEEKNFLVYPFDISVKSENDIEISIASIEIDLSIKKIAMLKYFLQYIQDMSLLKRKKMIMGKDNSTRVSKRKIFRQAFLEMRGMNMKVASIAIVFAKEDNSNSKLYDPLFCANMDTTEVTYSPVSNEYKLTSDVRCEYFNKFNEFWEPIIEKTHMCLQISFEHSISFDFPSGVGVVLSVQFLKTLKVLFEDADSNIFHPNNTIQTPNNVQRAFHHSNELKDISSSYKLLNNAQVENILMRNTYQFQIENLTGEDLLLILDEKSVMKIAHLKTIPIEKVLFQNDIFIGRKSVSGTLNSSFAQFSEGMMISTNNKIGVLKKTYSAHSAGSNVSSGNQDSLARDFKLTIQKKFRQQNEKLSQLKNIKYIHFQIPQLKKTFCINLLKPSQEIEIKTENSIYKQIKILVNIYLDSNGRKVVCLKSPIVLQNKLMNYSIEVQLSQREELSPFISSALLSYNSVIAPNSYVYLPIRYLNFNYFSVRPYFNNPQNCGTASYYQPYIFADPITREFNVLKNGRIIQSKLKRNSEQLSGDNNIMISNDLDHLKMICGMSLSSNEGLNEAVIYFEYPVEICNYLPGSIYLYFSKKDRVILSCYGHHNYRTVSVKESIIQVEPFSVSQLSFLNPEEIDYLNVVDMKHESESPFALEITLIKHMAGNGVITNAFEYNLDIHNGYTSQNVLVKVTSELCNKKIILSFFVDYMVVNDLDEDIDLLIQSNSREGTQKTLNVRSAYSSSYQNMNQNLKLNFVSKKHQRANSGIDMAVKLQSGLGVNRIDTIESEMISVTHKSTKNWGNEGNIVVEKVSKLEKSTSFITFEDHLGCAAVLGKYIPIADHNTNALPLPLPSKKSRGKIAIANNIIAISSQLLIDCNTSHNNALFYHCFGDNSTIPAWNINYFSLMNNDRIILRVSNSEDMEAQFVSDPNNIYKNHFLKLAGKNKNMSEILCKVKHLQDSLAHKRERPVPTKIITVKNKYTFANSSNLNLILTQDKCFNEGFYVLHPFDKVHFKWINYEKPLMVKLKLNESSFTCPFSIDNVGEFYFNLRLGSINKLEVLNKILKVCIVENQGRVTIFIEDATSDPPFCVENNTNFIFRFLGEESSSSIVAYPYKKVPFCFDNMVVNSIKISYLKGGLEEVDGAGEKQFKFSACINLNQLDEEKKIMANLCDIKVVLELIKNESMNYVIRLCDEDYFTCVNMNTSVTSSNNISISTSSNIPTKKRMKIRLSSKFIGMSFIDLCPKEIMYTHFSGIKFGISIYNKKFYKVKFEVVDLQCDNSLEDCFYEIILKLAKRKKLYSKSNQNCLKFLMEFSYNKIGNIMFINKLICEINDDVMMNLDGNFMSEIWNYVKNVHKVMRGERNLLQENEQVRVISNKRNDSGMISVPGEDKMESLIPDHKPSKMKILVHSISMSPISINLSFRPSYSMIKNLNKKQKLLFLISRVENFQFAFDKFSSFGVKSLDTINSILAKNFMKKNSEIITKYLLSIDLLLNVSNIFRHFKYGLDSIIHSMKLKRNDSYWKLPKQFLFGMINSVLIIISGINSSLIKFLTQFKRLNDSYYGYTLKKRLGNDLTLEDLKSRYRLFPALTDECKQKLQRQYMNNERVYFILSNLGTHDAGFLCYSNFLYGIKSNPHKRKLTSLMIFSVRSVFKILLLPVIIGLKGLNMLQFVLNISRREVIKPNKIRPTRYINKSSCKIEEYSRPRAIAYEKLLKTKKVLMCNEEEIEQYFTFHRNESVILTNMRFIYIYPQNLSDTETSTQLLNLISINLNHIFYYSYTDNTLHGKKSQMKIFFYDETTENIVLNKVNALTRENEEWISLKENGDLYLKSQMKSNLRIKRLVIETDESKNKNVLGKIRTIFLNKNINKTLNGSMNEFSRNGMQAYF